ncbi:MAG: hypothetical protein NT139_00020 [Candidatus Woesearchaeota archaeon]|nr:hypothetical protein [Candidatus Woesearchaeota archaeon]
MEIDISDLEEVQATRGGRKKPVFSLSRGGYFNMNFAFKKLNELDEPKSVSFRASLKEDKLIAALTFFESEDEGTFKITPTERKSSWFSGRSLFSQFGVDYSALVPKRKSLKLKTFIQKTDGIKYLILEIPLQKK